uniref:CLASRP_0 protein n=1 Tax=Fopius arisanus TaxID=64838 RepID=A0A0C9RAJ6_9HYME
MMSFSVKKTGGRMWHEARKQEKKIRGMLVDYRRRAERRRDYYEKIKSDPTQFLQLHGRPCKIHLDAAIAAAGDSSANMMPWQGHDDNLIDRFDVRAHLDWIPDPPNTIDMDVALTSEDRHINYERYRIIVQNEFLGVTEEKFLHQIHLEEQFGSSTKLDVKDKKKSSNNAAIGYNYDTDEPIPETIRPEPNASEEKPEDEDSDIDLDICVDVSQIEPSQAHEMNQVAQKYGLMGADYFSFLTQDFEEAETLRQARKQEEEKAMYSGRRSRRERRAFREKKMIGRVMSPPSYAARESPEYNPYRKSSSKSRSRSVSPVNTGQIMYITSFGGEEEAQGSCSQVTSSNAKKINYSQSRRRRSESPVNDRTRRVSVSRSRSRSRNRSRSYRSRDSRRSDSRSRRRNRGGSRRYRSRTRSRSRRNRSRHRRSHSRSRSSSSSRSRSRGRRSRSRSSSSSSKSKSRSKSRSRSPLERRKMRYSKSKSRSRSRSKSLDRSRSRSKSKARGSVARRSRSVENKTSALPRYYGRRGKSSSLELEISDNEEKNLHDAPKPPNISTNVNKPKAGLSTNSGAGHKVIGENHTSRAA